VTSSEPAVDLTASSSPTLGLVAEGVSKRFSTSDGEVLAVESVDLTVDKGSFVSIIGPSGCGKSTMLRMFCDLLPVTSGVLSINGHSVDQARQAREFAVVFQSPTLLPWRSVLRNVTLPLQVMGMDRRERDERARASLEMVGLADAEKRLPWQLSGGMQQRVSIARALSMEPSVLFMDEPFGALDEITRDRLNLELMRIWSQLEMTVMFITHSISEAVFLSTEVVVMSARPGQVTARIDIDLPQPRTAETREHPRFFELVTEVRHELMSATEASG
jgi:NitT/TauT family transport system ATP-binding protein